MTKEIDKNKKNGAKVQKYMVGIAAVAIIGLIASIGLKSKNSVKNVVQFTEPSETYITEAEYDYYYKTRLLELKSAKGDQLDLKKPLAVQYIDDEITYEDYLSTYSLDKVRSNHSIISRIIEEDEWKVPSLEKMYDEFLEELKVDYNKYKAKNNITFKEFIKQVYGENMTEDLLKEIFVKDNIAKQYLSEQLSKEEPRDSDVEKVYKERKDDFKVKEYMYYDLEFKNEEEKGLAEKKAYKMFEIIKDEQTFIDTVKIVDHELQEKIKSNKDKYSDEFIKEQLTDRVSSKDAAANFTTEWLYNEDGVEPPKPKSSAILVNKNIKDQNKGVFRVVFFIGDLENVEETGWNFDQVYLSFKNANKEEVKKEAEEILASLKAIDNSEKLDSEVERLIKERSDGFTVIGEERGKYREVFADQLKAKGNAGIAEFLKESKENDIELIESENGFNIIVNRGTTKPRWFTIIRDEINATNKEEFLRETYSYAEKYKLVADKDGKPYINIDKNKYKTNSEVEKVINK